LLHALYTSVQDLQIKYLEGLRSQDEEVLQQARHKIKHTVTLFQLKKIHSVLSEGKTIISTTGFAVLDQHEREFVHVTDDLLRELEEEMSCCCAGTAEFSTSILTALLRSICILSLGYTLPHATYYWVKSQRSNSRLPFSS